MYLRRDLQTCWQSLSEAEQCLFKNGFEQSEQTRALKYVEPLAEQMRQLTNRDRFECNVLAPELHSHEKSHRLLIYFIRLHLSAEFHWFSFEVQWLWEDFKRKRIQVYWYPGCEVRDYRLFTDADYVECMLQE